MRERVGTELHTSFIQEWREDGRRKLHRSRICLILYCNVINIGDKAILLPEIHVLPDTTSLPGQVLTMTEIKSSCMPSHFKSTWITLSIYLFR